MSNGEHREIAGRLRLAALDPMWADHAEVLKTTLQRAERSILSLLTALEQMNAVSKWQTGRYDGPPDPLGLPKSYHPLTCGVDSGHSYLFPLLKGESIVLVCADCGYEQEHIPSVVTLAAKEAAARAGNR